AEQPDCDEDLADHDGDGSEEEARAIESMKEQDLTQEIEPDGEDGPQAESEVLEAPAQRAAGVAQRWLQTVQHGDGRQELDDHANLTYQGGLRVTEAARAHHVRAEGPREVGEGGRDQATAAQDEGEPPVARH